MGNVHTPASKYNSCLREKHMIEMQTELAAHGTLFIPERLTIKNLNFCAIKNTVNKMKRKKRK